LNQYSSGLMPLELLHRSRLLYSAPDELRARVSAVIRHVSKPGVRQNATEIEVRAAVVGSWHQINQSAPRLEIYPMMNSQLTEHYRCRSVVDGRAWGGGPADHEPELSVRELSTIR
jgi:hypothetical protein